MPERPIKTRGKETTMRWRQFNWNVHLLIGLVGIVVLGSVSFGFYRSYQLYQKYFPLIDASMEMRLEATTAYLWFEEMMGGDKSKNIDEILIHLDRADWYSKAMIEGGETEHVKLMRNEDAAFNERILELQVQLTTQRELMLKRIAETSNAGPGSDIDSQYHETLEDFVQNSIGLEMEIKNIMVKDYRAFTFISMGVIGVCLFLFVVTGYAFYRYEGLRQRNYSERLQLEQLLARNEKMAALGTMISGLAHEMNNPNNFISFNIPILRDYIRELIPIIDNHADRQPNFELYHMPYNEFRGDLINLLDTIENGSTRINRIVSDLKAFSKKKDKVKMECVDLGSVIEKAAAICRVNINSAIDTFEINLPDETLEATGDAEVIQLILINLLINAAEAVDKSNSTIQLRVKPNDRVPDIIRIEVQDNGSGIRAEDMDRIFNPFFSTKPTTQSSGMGLYLCRALADQMEALIEAESDIGVGSTFTLLIKKHHADPQSQRATPAES